MITIVNELDLLDIKKRQEIIKSIQSDANQQRKNQKLKAYEIYKDMTKKWVIESILKEFSQETVSQMVARAANISIVKKIVNKKAKAYAGGCTRTIEGDDANTQRLADLAKFLNIDQVMKKADRFSELLKNVMIQVIYQNDLVEADGAGQPKKKLVNRIFLPHQYDVICHAHDPCTPLAYVLSDYYDTKTTIMNVAASDSTGYREQKGLTLEKVGGAQEMEKKSTTFIFWSKSLHFTTDEKGVIISELTPDAMLNPLGEQNDIHVHDDQDDGYWCDGGNDLVDGGVLLNVLMTDMFAIMNVQGWGQLVVTGKKVPSSIQGGPHKAITFEFDTGDPVPKVEYVSSNPPIEEWRESITMYVALLLSTNNLSTKNVSTKLDGAGQFPSGLAMMIDESESTESVEDKQHMFKDVEAALWKKNFAAQNYLVGNGVAVEDLNKIGRIETKGRVQVKFNQAKTIMSEAEKVDILKKKKESGLYKIVELLQIKNPDLSAEDAEKQALELLEDRMKFAVLYQAAVTDMVGKMNGELKDSEGDDADPAEGVMPGQESGAKLPVAGAAAGATDVQKTALNGAQLASLVDVVAQVASGQIPRESAVQIILQAFPYIDQAEAEAIVGRAGKGFKPTKEETPAPPAGRNQLPMEGKPRP